jgi:hypothetical protein
MITTASSCDYVIFLEKIRHDDINKTGKRKTCCRSLKSGQDLREISKEARISPRDIGAIGN